jgi:GNAT superfamily N-acetyltransferase
MQIEYLADHPEAIPVLAKWFAAEWGYLNPGANTVAGYIESLPSRAQREALPLCLVGLVDGEIVATSTLKLRELEYAADADYWLASVYVREDLRGRGHGKAIVEAAEDIAVSRGLTPLYLYSPSKAAFYEQLGWRAIGRVMAGGKPATVMTKYEERT